MIRQLPKLSIPKLIASQRGLFDAFNDESDVKIYDVITDSTQKNSEGNTMQLQLHQKDSEVNEGVRELHGRIVLNTESLPDQQDLKFGFLFSNGEQEGRFDGLQLSMKMDALQ